MCCVVNKCGEGGLAEAIADTGDDAHLGAAVAAVPMQLLRLVMLLHVRVSCCLCVCDAVGVWLLLSPRVPCVCVCVPCRACCKRCGSLTMLLFMVAMHLKTCCILRCCLMCVFVLCVPPVYIEDGVVAAVAVWCCRSCCCQC